MKPRFGLLMATGLAALTLAACGPTYVGMRVGPPPPVPYNAYVGVAPGPGYVWTEGFYDLRGSRWAWVNGRWAVPPRPRAVWVAPRWEPRGGHYYFRQGHWR